VEAIHGGVQTRHRSGLFGSVRNGLCTLVKLTYNMSGLAAASTGSCGRSSPRTGRLTAAGTGGMLRRSERRDAPFETPVFIQNARERHQMDPARSPRPTAAASAASHHDVSHRDMANAIRVL